MSTTTDERQPAYTVTRNAEGLTEREVEVRRLLSEGINQNAIAEQLGISKQRVSEIKGLLKSKGKLEPPKPLELLSNSEWRAVSAGLRKFTADQGPTSTGGKAAVRALIKIREGLLPNGVTW